MSSFNKNAKGEASMLRCVRDGEEELYVLRYRSKGLNLTQQLPGNFEESREIVQGAKGVVVAAVDKADTRLPRTFIAESIADPDLHSRHASTKTVKVRFWLSITLHH